MGCRVWGVDLDDTAAREARLSCEGVVVGDLNCPIHEELGRLEGG